MTIREAYGNSVLQLRARDGENEARAMMRRVLQAVTGIANAHLLQPDRVLSPSEEAIFAIQLRELEAGRPLPYVVGNSEFCGLEFRCDERALIPRPETESLVETALKELQNVASPRIADLGTGSGCIAVSLAHARRDARIFATDLAPDTLELARENAAHNGVSESITFLAGTENQWAAPIALFAPFDAILSNPPYIAAREIESLQLQVQREPRLALDGGADGLDPYRALATQCAALLVPEGFLLCELGAGQFSDARAIFEASGWRVAEAIRDFAEHERVLCARRAFLVRAA